MDIQNIYKIMVDSGLVDSQYQFSRVYLSRHESHFAYLKSKNLSPSIDTAMRLFINTRYASERMNLTRKDIQLIDSINEAVWDSIESAYISENQITK